MTDSGSASPMTLMTIAAGFRRARLLAVAVEVGAFDALADSASGTSLATFVKSTNLPERTASLLLDGLVGLDLVIRHDRPRRDEAVFANSAVAEQFLVRGTTYYFGDFLLFNDFRGYQGWMTLADAIRNDAPTSWPNQRPLDAHTDPEVARAMFRGALDPGTRWTASIVARSFDFGGFDSVLDLGGGIGAYCHELSEHHPGLRFTLFDRPPAIELAAENLAGRSGSAPAVNLVAGDFWGDPIPTGHDVILLSNVLADWSDHEVTALLGRCKSAVNPGGAIVVAETFFDDFTKSSPEIAVMHGIHMVLETHSGRNRTRAEYRALFADAGFRRVEEVEVLEVAPGANGLLVGRP